MNLQKRVKRHVWSQEHRFLVSLPPSLAPLCRAEMEAAGFAEIRPVPEGFYFSGKIEEAYRGPTRPANRIPSPGSVCPTSRPALRRSSSARAPGLPGSSTLTLQSPSFSQRGSAAAGLNMRERAPRRCSRRCAITLLKRGCPPHGKPPQQPARTVCISVFTSAPKTTASNCAST